MKKTISGIFRLALLSVAVLVAAGCPSMDAGGGGGSSLAELTAGDMVFESLDGEEISLREAAAGAPIYAVFFASWCKICMQEIPHHNEVFRKYGGDGLAVYGVNVNETPETVSAIIEKKDIRYPVVRHRKTSGGFSITALPLIMVFDSSGEQVYMGPVPPDDDVLENLVRSSE